MSSSAASLAPPLCGDELERGIELGPDGITLVSGPAGSGKSTLLSLWYHQLADRGSGAVWSSPDVRCRDLRELQAAIASAAECLSPADGGSPERVLGSVDASARTLFVDGLDHVDPGVIDDLVVWLGLVPGPRWRLVLAGRSSFHLSVEVGRNWTVRTVGGSELRLGQDEMTRALASTVPTLAAEHRPIVAEQLDGWAGGLGLARALPLESSPGADAPVLDGGHPVVADYLEREVLSGLPLSDQQFLMCCAVLAEPTGAACDHVTGSSGGSDRLARLASMNAFVIRDHERYRWVPLGRDFLLHRLRGVGEEAELGARQGLVQWCVAEGRYSEAAMQAIETADSDALADLVLIAGLEMIARGEAVEVVSWLDHLLPEAAETEAGLGAIAALALWAAGGDASADAIDRWLASASRTDGGRPPAGAGSLAGAVDAVSAACSRLGPKAKKRLARRALQREEAAASAWTALSHAAVGLAAYLAEEHRDARRELTESLRIQSGLDDDDRRWVGHLFSPIVLAALALVELDSGGHLHRAEALISAAELQRASGNSGPTGSGVVGLATSRAVLVSGDRTRALDIAIETASRARLAPFKVLAYLDAASIRCERGEIGECERLLAEADRLMSTLPDPGRQLTKRRLAVERQIRVGRSAPGLRSDVLTEREAEVLRLLDSDLSRREIAEQLYLSFDTVKTYVRRLYQKLGVSSRSAAVETAYSWGWLPLPS